VPFCATVVATWKARSYTREMVSVLH